MINIVCVKWGNKYGAEYVNILFDMVNRNLLEADNRRYICFTDDPSGLDDYIEARPLPGDLEGWWNKLYLFQKGLFDDNDRVVYFDLDTVIVGQIDDILDYQGNFAILRDFCRPGGLQSSVMLWKANDQLLNDLWLNYKKLGCPIYQGGDQEAIEQYFYSLGMLDYPEILQNIFPSEFVSYKVNCQFKLPTSARIVVFHGEPRPHQVSDEWMSLVWKKGGARRCDDVFDCNVANSKRYDNVKRVLESDIVFIKPSPENCGTVIIIGGAPSVKNYLSDIRNKAQQEGCVLFSINNSHRYLANEGIHADFHVMGDARPENVAFVPLQGEAIYSSQCDPIVFEEANNRGVKVWGWHHLDAREVVKEISPEGQHNFINGGSTTGLAAMVIAHCMGFRKIHVYGMDSSFDNNHHAYDQPLNDADEVITAHVLGNEFKTTHWMARQAREFLVLANMLIQNGAEISVHGHGLLPAMATESERQASEGLESLDKIVQRNGIWYPAHCKHIEDAHIVTKDDIGEIIKFCDPKRMLVAVQAGGNVGLWAKEFSKHFSSVYTFEPDSTNFQCLTLNVTEPNVIKMQAALGAYPKCIDLQREKGNCGAFYVSGSGSIPVLRIDDLGLNSCDLIQLDIEGYEFFALQGALRTILRSKPVIVVENKGLAIHQGLPANCVLLWLKALGYELVKELHRDLVFVYNRE